jgi:hypothetical protein
MILLFLHLEALLKLYFMVFKTPFIFMKNIISGLRADPGFRRLTKFMLADINYRPSSKFLLRILKAGGAFPNCLNHNNE